MSSLDYELLKDRIRRSVAVAVEISVEPDTDDWQDIRFGSLERLPIAHRWRATASVFGKRGRREYLVTIPGVIVESSSVTTEAVPRGTVSDHHDGRLTVWEAP